VDLLRRAIGRHKLTAGPAGPGMQAWRGSQDAHPACASQHLPAGQVGLTGTEDRGGRDRGLVVAWELLNCVGVHAARVAPGREPPMTGR